MPDLTCPVCRLTTAPAVAIETLAICGACGASLHLEAGTVRRATLAELTALAPAALAALRVAHGKIARPSR